MEVTADEQPSLVSPPLTRSASQPRPAKGILKNTGRHDSDSGVSHILWDENNLALNEGQKDSVMKITEPKTPYVRYNPITDEVEGDIPGLSLDGGGKGPSSPGSPVTSAEVDFPSRRSSLSGSGRRPGSETSSRSTSFNLPSEERVLAKPFGAGDFVMGEVEIGEELDEESAAKHAAFVRARGRHYSNEAEAMKRARQLMADEEDGDSPPPPQANGADH